MTAPKDGGAAFPRPGDIEHNTPQVGMSLRDYFAAHALPMVFRHGAPDRLNNWPEIAKQSYLCADAMLAERAK